MTLGEFRNMTSHLADETEIFLLSAYNTNDANYHRVDGGQVEFSDGVADINLKFEIK